jgi:hypothetical protein
MIAGYGSDMMNDDPSHSVFSFMIHSIRLAEQVLILVAIWE